MDYLDDFYGIIGCGGHARSVADTILCSKKNAQIVFFDDNAQEDEFILGEFPVMKLTGNLEYLAKSKNVFLGIGDNAKRCQIVDILKAEGITKNIYRELVSINARVGVGSTIGVGTYIGDAVHIGPQVTVGEFSIVNTSAVVEHESSIGDYSHISVNATICGRCKIGENTFVGAGAVVKDNVVISNNIIVGAGGVVVRDLIIPGIYVGNPVRLKK
ncbi:MAG: acetyltransferase [Butyrivibrio sp.]|uniref:acetyltransferase n=1 Tax=Butyrivibrio sp. TaxID=28121 RepID=UPI0025C1E1DC|nr:acetyltransferase [Butyrivibrio sp.]MBQ6587188.1 acetyltransferase [Butyrivibrio sp.]